MNKCSYVYSCLSNYEIVFFKQYARPRPILAVGIL